MSLRRPFASSFDILRLLLEKQCRIAHLRYIVDAIDICTLRCIAYLLSNQATIEPVAPTGHGHRLPLIDMSQEALALAMIMPLAVIATETTAAACALRLPTSIDMFRDKMLDLLRP